VIVANNDRHCQQKGVEFQLTICIQCNNAQLNLTPRSPIFSSLCSLCSTLLCSLTTWCCACGVGANICPSRQPLLVFQALPGSFSQWHCIDADPIPAISSEHRMFLWRNYRHDLLRQKTCRNEEHAQGAKQQIGVSTAIL